MTYEQFRWLLDGLCQVEPEHGQRFYNEMGTQIAGALASELRNVNSGMAEILAAMVKKKEELAQKEAELTAQAANLEGVAKQLHQSMVAHATDVLFSRVGKA